MSIRASSNRLYRIHHNHTKELLKGYLSSVGTFYLFAFFFGAPLFSLGSLFFAAFQTLLTFHSLRLACSDDTHQFWACVDNQPRTLLQLYCSRCAAASVVGSWLGAIVIPLDWDRWWQKWPICSLFGSLFCILLAALSVRFRLFTNPPFERQKRDFSSLLGIYTPLDKLHQQKKQQRTQPNQKIGGSHTKQP